MVAVPGVRVVDSRSLRAVGRDQVAEGKGVAALAEGLAEGVGAEDELLDDGAGDVPAEDGEADGPCDDDADGEGLGVGERDGEGGGEGALVVGTEVGIGESEMVGGADGVGIVGDSVAAGEPTITARATRNAPTSSTNTRKARTTAPQGLRRRGRGAGGGGGAAGLNTSVPVGSPESTAVVASGARIGVAATDSPPRTRSRSSRISSAVE
jgi:hypothetical protein